MLGLAGIRVMRGRDWAQDNADGGEGHLGTLTRLLSDGKVHVLWDKGGQESTCSAGGDGKFELRVFDTAQAGIRHPSSVCAECKETNLYGMLWRCQDCADCVLCSLCYGNDKHNIKHGFLRIDHYQSEGVKVKKRKVSVRMRSMGVFPGAKVTRGRDWAWGQQDGGPGSEGVVQDFENVAPDSSRNLVRVLWNHSDKSNSYRLGFRGHVDVCCMEEDVGPFYYRDHLPLLDASKLPYPLAPPEAFKAKPPTAAPTPATSATTSTTLESPASSTSASSSPSSMATASSSSTSDTTPAITTTSSTTTTASQSSSAGSKTSPSQSTGGASNQSSPQPSPQPSLRGRGGS